MSAPKPTDPELIGTDKRAQPDAEQRAEAVRLALEALDAADDWGADTWRVTGYGRERARNALLAAEAELAELWKERNGYLRDFLTARERSERAEAYAKRLADLLVETRSWSMPFHLRRRIDAALSEPTEGE